MVMYKAKPVSRREINDFVRKLRRRFNMEYVDKIDILRFIENDIYQLYSDFKLEIVAVDDMVDPCALAETFPDEHRMIIREDIYLKAYNGDGFARFTIAHELCHLFKHHEKNVSFCRRGTTLKTYEDPEWQADAFAGEFLAPGYLIVDKTIQQIHQDHGVTTSAARVQKEVVRRYPPLKWVINMRVENKMH